MNEPGQAHPPAPLPLAGMRVLECGDAIAAAYAGRLLCDLGADVVKVESLRGDQIRRTGSGRRRTSVGTARI